MEIRIYFEGKSTLKAGFDDFLSEFHNLARQRQVTLRLIAAKNGPSDFKKALRSHPDSINILLKDSEQAFVNPAVLCHLHDLDPKLESHVFWMVELMESWFLADPDALADYYGQNFSRKAIGQTANVETVPKAEVFNRLKSATKETKKGGYDKATHASYILERLDPARVQERAPNCRKFFEYLRSILGH